MAVDLAFDFKKKDLAISPGLDVEVVTGQASVDQRIRARLMVEQGQWALDPSNGQLGSHLKDGLRMQPTQALQAIPMLVKEALAPMPDIEVQEVQVTPNIDPRAIDILILYRMVDQGNEADALQTSITVVG